MRQSLACALAVLCLLLASGCGPKRPRTVKVSGKVTYGGGTFPKPGLVYFTPLEPAEGFPRRAGTGAFGPDGSFSVKTFVDGDGLMPGRYRVAFECWEVPPSLMNQPAKSYLPEKYQHGSTSGIELTVEVGSKPLDVRYDVPRPGEEPPAVETP